MKVYISTDIEGVAGITSWDEANHTHADYEYFRKQMSREVAAACRGALAAGATEILVKDSHGTGRNIIPSELPKEVKLLRGWAREPFSMVQGLDESFDALMFVGYHSAANSDGNPLAHTMRSSKVTEMRINGERISEFNMHSYAAGSVGVPVVFLSGDKLITEEVKKFNNNIETFFTNEGVGNSTISIHPDAAVEGIEESVKKALKQDLKLCKVEMPENFELEIEFIHHYDAYKGGFYPKAEQVDEKTVRLKSDNYFDILTAIMFLV